MADTRHDLTAHTSGFPDLREAELASIEVLGDVAFPPDTAVTLTGDVGREVADSLGRAAKTGLDVFKSSRRTVYELLPSEATKAGLADGTLRWATPKNGDASVLIKNQSTGRIAGHGELRQVRPKPASVLGPAVWQALAVATQQHYLNEINGKLADLDAKVDEVLARLDDETQGVLKRAATLAGRTATALAQGETVSDARVDELRQAAGRADEAWHALLIRTRRHVEDYAQGTATADDVELSFALLLEATEALVACADVVVSLPHREVDALHVLVREEGERIYGAMDELRTLGDEMCRVNSEWAEQWAEYRRKRGDKKMLAREWQHRRPIKKLRKPHQQTLPTGTVSRCLDLVLPPAPVDRLLVEVAPDGAVRVAAASPT